MIIYCARNIKTNKMYIGKTSKTLNERKLKHYLSAERGSSTNFHRALAKGTQFDWTILEHVTDIDSINEREKFWIQSLDTYKTGYNMTIGGDGGCTYKKGDAVYERIKHKLSENSKGNKNPGANPAIHQKAQQTILTNIQNGIYFESGESHGNFKGKFVEKHKNYKGNEASINAKRVSIFGVEYDSLQAAARAYNICAETVSNRCKNSRYLDWKLI